jgi:hypothetical protein
MDQVLQKHFVRMNILLNPSRSSEKKVRSAALDRYPKNIMPPVFHKAIQDPSPLDFISIAAFLVVR